MTPVFEDAGFEVAAAAVAADARTPRRCCASAPTSPTLRFGLEIHDVGDALRRHASSRSSSRCSAAAASCARSTPARARCRARSSTASTRSSSATAPGLAWRSSQADGGWRSPSPSSSPTEQRGGRRASSGVSRATCCCSSPTRATSRPRRSARCASSSPSVFGLDRRRPPDAALDRRLPDVRARRRRAAAGRSIHHPFTAPRAARSTTRARMRSRGYDLVLDGVEIGGGSIRIHRPEVQQQVFEVLGIVRGGGAGALRLPARRAALRRAAARRHRASASTGSSRSSPAASRSAT